jgi:hypothetical protein
MRVTYQLPCHSEQNGASNTVEKGKGKAVAPAEPEPKAAKDVEEHDDDDEGEEAEDADMDEDEVSRRVHICKRGHMAIN